MYYLYIATSEWTVVNGVALSFSQFTSHLGAIPLIFFIILNSDVVVWLIIIIRVIIWYITCFA